MVLPNGVVDIIRVGSGNRCSSMKGMPANLTTAPVSLAEVGVAALASDCFASESDSVAAMNALPAWISGSSPCSLTEPLGSFPVAPWKGVILSTVRPGRHVVPTVPAERLRCSAVEFTEFPSLRNRGALGGCVAFAGVAEVTYREELLHG